MVTGRSDRPEAHCIAGLHRAGVEIRLVGDTSGPYFSVLQQAGVPAGHLVIPNRVSWPAIRAIHRAIRAFQPDIVHVFTNKALACTIPALIGSRARLVCYRGTTGHLSLWDPGSWFSYRHPRVSAVICVSDAVRDYVRTVRRPDQVLTIRKGHDPAWYASGAPADLAEFGVPRGAFVAGLVANMRRLKGAHVLVAALRQLPPELGVHVLLVGQIRDPEVEAATRDPRLAGRLHAAGFRTDATRLMSGFTVSIMPSLEREGLPKAVVEGMAQGIPAVVSAAGGLPELVEDGVCGRVVPPGDASALAAALRELATEPGRCRAMGQRALEQIQTKFNNVRMQAETRALYERLLAGQSAALDIQNCKCPVSHR
jgi:glycosyltransferase involved in cell wall biosynthesis